MILYGISAVYSIFLFRKGFRQDNRVNYLLLFAGFLVHTLAMTQRGFALNRCPVRNLYEATLFIEWTMLAAYLVFGLWHRLRFLGAFASPFLFGIGLFALMPGLDVIKPDARFHFGGRLAQFARGAVCPVLRRVRPQRGGRNYVSQAGTGTSNITRRGRCSRSCLRCNGWKRPPAGCCWRALFY